MDLRPQLVCLAAWLAEVLLLRSPAMLLAGALHLLLTSQEQTEGPFALWPWSFLLQWG